MYICVRVEIMKKFTVVAVLAIVNRPVQYLGLLFTGIVLRRPRIKNEVNHKHQPSKHII